VSVNAINAGAYEGEWEAGEAGGADDAKGMGGRQKAVLGAGKEKEKEEESEKERANLVTVEHGLGDEHAESLYFEASEDEREEDEVGEAEAAEYSAARAERRRRDQVSVKRRATMGACRALLPEVCRGATGRAWGSLLSLFPTPPPSPPPPSPLPPSPPPPSPPPPSPPPFSPPPLLY
jgi:hypothetical protein